MTPSPGPVRQASDAGLPYTLEVRTAGRHAYVHGSFHGDITTESLVRYYSDLKDMMESHGCIRLLTDLSAGKTVGSIYEVPGVIDSYQRMGLSKRWRRAIVVPPDDAKARLFETTALSRGHQVRLFDDTTRAIAWLCR